MSFIVTISLIFGLLVGGGAGLAYVADGSTPGDILYDLDRAIESLQYTLTQDPTNRSQQALGFAEERLNELKQLVAEGAPPDLIEQAAMGYGVSIYQAVDPVRAEGVSGPDQALIDSEVLRALLMESLSTHTVVLTQVRDQVAEQAKSSIDLAIGYSQIGQTMVEEIFAEGLPGGRPEGLPDGPPEGVPAGVPEGLPNGLPEGVPAEQPPGSGGGNP